MHHYLYIGLGNPGEKFEHTRHNVGIQALRSWVAGRESVTVEQQWKHSSSFDAEIARVRVGEAVTVTCFFPTTFMNRSGAAVAAWLRYHELPLNQVLLIHDDLELSFSDIRFDRRGSARGHNGVRSVQQALGTLDVARLRIGIGRPAEGEAVDGYVLSAFTAVEEQALNGDVIPRVREELLRISITQRLDQE